MQLTQVLDGDQRRARFAKSIRRKMKPIQENLPVDLRLQTTPQMETRIGSDTRPTKKTQFSPIELTSEADHPYQPLTKWLVVRSPEALFNLEPSPPLIPPLAQMAGATLVKMLWPEQQVNLWPSGRLPESNKGSDFPHKPDFQNNQQKFHRQSVIQYSRHSNTLKDENESKVSVQYAVNGTQFVSSSISSFSSYSSSSSSFTSSFRRVCQELIHITVVSTYHLNTPQ